VQLKEGKMWIGIKEVKHSKTTTFFYFMNHLRNKNIKWRRA